MLVKDMLNSLRTINYERVCIRDKEGNEICTCYTNSEGISPFTNYVVTEWFPHGTSPTGATFTIYVRLP